MKRLLALDPASNKFGCAIFEEGVLMDAFTLKSNGETPLDRRLNMAELLLTLMDNRLRAEGDSVIIASEEPFLLGKSAHGMQRLLGYIELITDGSVFFYHPSTVKKAMGSGSMEKLEMALQAGEDLKTEEEKEFLARLISKEEWDSTDAICVGLTHMKKYPETVSTVPGEDSCQ